MLTVSRYSHAAGANCVTSTVQARVRSHPLHVLSQRMRIERAGSPQISRHASEHAVARNRVRRKRVSSPVRASTAQLRRSEQIVHH